MTVSKARIATMHDFPEILRLTNLMYDAFGFTDIDDSWELPATAEFEKQLWSGLACAFVIDDPADVERAQNETRAPKLIASGIGLLQQRLPSFWAPSGKVGYVQWMSTDLDVRSTGLGSRILAALMRWFDERDVDFVDLNASDAANDFYKRATFDRPHFAGMRAYFRDAGTREWIHNNLGV